MRYSRQHKDETHNRLLKKAAEEFRRNGVQGTGIAPLMGRLGLTHGGFYAHFDSKNELIAQATGTCPPQVLGERWEELGRLYSS
jgi:TetR/AcrR family transcriptional repressor of nem operon